MYMYRLTVGNRTLAFIATQACLLFFLGYLYQVNSLLEYESDHSDVI